MRKDPSFCKASIELQVAPSKEYKSKFGGASAALRPLQSLEQPNIRTVAMGTPQSIEYQ